MLYNDFHILKDDEYKILSEQYSLRDELNENEFQQLVCIELNSTINLYYGISNEFNYSINNALKDCHNTIKKIYDNLQTNYVENHEVEIATFNLFNYLNQLNNLISLFYRWEQINNKKYDLLIKTSITQILKSLNKIYKALNESNIKFYKYM